jgi:hypothetical protein
MSLFSILNHVSVAQLTQPLIMYPSLYQLRVCSKPAPRRYHYFGSKEACEGACNGRTGQPSFSEENLQPTDAGGPRPWCAGEGPNAPRRAEYYQRGLAPNSWMPRPITYFLYGFTPQQATSIGGYTWHITCLNVPRVPAQAAIETASVPVETDRLSPCCESTHLRDCQN